MFSRKHSFLSEEAKFNFFTIFQELVIFQQMTFEKLGLNCDDLTDEIISIVTRTARENYSSIFS